MKAAGLFGVWGIVAMVMGAASGCGALGSAADGTSMTSGPLQTKQLYGSGYGRGGYGQGGYDPGGYGQGRYGLAGDYGSPRCYGRYVNPSYNRSQVVEENATAFRLRGDSIWRPKCVSAPNIVEENAEAFRRAGSAIWQRK